MMFTLCLQRYGITKRLLRIEITDKSWTKIKMQVVLNTYLSTGRIFEL